jgi:lipoyl(octanoyl) transferase
VSLQLPDILHLGRTDYEPVWQAMKQFTEQRDAETQDEFWLTEHNPVYTQGLNGRKEHVLNTGNIPVVKVDRGGQVTYHGPGQLIVYFLLDLNRLGIGIRKLVMSLEQAVVNLLQGFDIDAHARRDAPGVYVGDAKIAALGLRVRKACCYHGLSLNLDMDLTPFSGIDPCGYRDLPVIQLVDLVPEFSRQQVEQ